MLLESLWLMVFVFLFFNRFLVDLVSPCHEFENVLKKNCYRRCGKIASFSFSLGSVGEELSRTDVTLFMSNDTGVTWRAVSEMAIC